MTTAKPICGRGGSGGAGALAVAMSLLGALAACAPRLDPGPTQAALAEAPVPWVSVAAEAQASLSLLLDAGSAHDPLGREGTAALAANAVFHRSSVRALAQTLGVGATLAVETDLVRWHLRCPAGLDGCVEVLHLALSGTPTPEDLASARAALLGALGERAAALPRDPYAASNLLLRQILFHGHPYAHHPDGRLGTLPLLSEAEVSRFREGRYVRERARLVTAGPTTEATASQARRALDLLPPLPATEAVWFDPPRRDQRSLTLVEGPADSVWLAVGGVGAPSPTSLERPAWELAVATLGDDTAEGGLLRGALADLLPPAGRVVVRPGAWRADEAGYLPEAVRRDEAWGLQAGPFAPEAAVSAVERVLQTLDSWSTTPTPSERLEAARAVLAAQQARAAQDPSRPAEWSLACDLLRRRGLPVVSPRWGDPSWAGPGPADVDRTKAKVAGTLPVALVLVGGETATLQADLQARLPDLALSQATLADRLR